MQDKTRASIAVAAAAVVSMTVAHAQDVTNERNSPLEFVNRSNVGRLAGAWTFELGMSSHASPVVKDGVMYVTAGSQVVALDAATGELRWSRVLDIPTSGFFKGVALGEGLVFAGLSNGEIVALDQGTGALVWRQNVGDAGVRRSTSAVLGLTPQYISATPAYAEGLLISGLSNGDFEIRGRVVALDAKTGRIAWHFDTVPAPGNPGSETWPAGSQVWDHGGGGVWMTPAVDAELGMVYFGVGNPVPQWGGEARRGDNLFTDSLVALDLKTGRHRWHYQLVHHDIWEYDLGTPVITYEVERPGAKPLKAIAAMRTDGNLFLFNRETGSPIFPIAERATPQNARLYTAPTQPFPVGADQLGPRCVPDGILPPGFAAKCYFDPVDYDQPNSALPWPVARVAPMAFSPDTGMFYATGRISGFWLRRTEDPNYFFPPSNIPGEHVSGVIAAIDSHTNKIAWRKAMPYSINMGSGVLVTQGGLLFHGEPDGALLALDAASGAELWRFQTGSPIETTVSTYAVGTVQFVAVTATKTIWAFKVGGTLPQRPPPLPPSTVEEFPGVIEDAERIGVGAKIHDFGLGSEVREFFDEYALSPMRARVDAGAEVVWTNHGKAAHTLIADDGSWSTPTLRPGESASIKLPKTGKFIYHCKEHPWTYGQLIVE